MAQKEPIRNFVLHDRHGHDIDFSSFSVVSDVSVTFHAGVGEPYCESRYQGGTLYLDFYNIKGEGITGITYDESQEDGGTNYIHISTDGGNEYDFPVRNGSRGNGITSIDTVESQEDDDYNVVRIHCTDDESEEGTEFRIKNGKRGNGIASVTEELSDQDGGVNTHTIHYTDPNVPDSVIHTRNGRRGRTGDSAVWDEESGLVANMAHELGYSELKVVSQKGVTEGIDDLLIKNVVGWQPKTTQRIAQTVINQDGSITSTTATGHYVYYMEVADGEVVELTASPGTGATNTYVTIAISDTIPAAGGSSQIIERVDVSDTDMTYNGTLVMRKNGYLCVYMHGVSLSCSARSGVTKTEDLQEQIDAITTGGNQQISLVNSKVYETGRVDVGDVYAESLVTNNVYNSVKVAVEKYDRIHVKGKGGLFPLLWCIVDSANKVVAKSTGNLGTAEYVVLDIGQDGYVYINAMPSDSTYPFSAYKTNTRNLDYIAEQVKKIPTDIIPKSKWLAMGDSITAGWYSYFTDESQDQATYGANPDVGWVKKVCDMTGKTVVNVGIGGTGYCCRGSSTAKNAVDLVEELDLTGIDLVTLAYGINDYKSIHDYGSHYWTLGGMEDTTEPCDKVIPSMRYVLESILALKPSVKIVVVMPLNARGYSSARLGDESTNYALGHQNSNEDTLQDYFDAMVEVCEYYGIEYIDLTHKSCIGRKSMAKLLPDGVHPSQDAHTLLAREIATKLPY